MLNDHWQDLIDEWGEGFVDMQGSAAAPDPMLPWAAVFLGSYIENKGTARRIELYPDRASAEIAIFKTELEPVALANLATGEQWEIYSRER